MKKMRSIICMVILLIFCIYGSISSSGNIFSKGSMPIEENKPIELETIQVTVKTVAVSSPPQQLITIKTLECTKNYVPSEEEREFAYKIAFAEAGREDSMGQTLVINAAINNMRAREFSNLIEEFNEKGRYSCVIEGKVYIIYKDKSGNQVQKLVTDDYITEELKEAVDRAFDKDYTEELLREAAERKGLNSPKYYEGGALYFYNPKGLSEERARERENIEVTFTHGRHVFYRYW